MPIYKMKGSKDGKQKYRVRVNYQDNSGSYRQTDRIVYGLSEAKETEKNLTDTLRNQPTAKQMTLNDLFDEYISSKAHEVRESTLDKSQRILKRHVLSALGDKPLSKLNKPILVKWKSEMSEKPSAKNGAKLSIAMLHNIFGEFRALLNFAVKMDYIPKNLLTEIGNFKSPIEVKPEMLYYTPDEFKRYIATAREYAESCPSLSGWDYYVFFNIAFYTGLRKGEIFALRWSDIKGDYLNVTRSINQKLKGADRETAPKNRSSIRTLQIPNPLIKVLDEHKYRYAKVPAFTDNYRICGGPEPIRDSSVTKINEKFAEDAGLKHIRLHDFRHSHASLLANEGINIQEIARRLGHSKIEMTWNTYAHLYPREEERAVKILNKIV